MQDVAGVPAGFRWSGALAVVLALHATAAWMLSNHRFPPMVMPAAPDAVMVDLAPDLPPVQPAEVVPPAPAEMPPPPVPVAQVPPPAPPVPVAEAPPVEPPPPVVEAEAVLPVPPPPPPPRPQPKPKPRMFERPVTPTAVPPARLAEAQPTQVEQAAPQTSARPPAPASTAVPSWRSDLLGRLQRAKRYPDLARSRGIQGVATVTFTMDRLGRVLSVGLVRDSGSGLLDDEAVALVHRAEPLPRPPEEMPGSTVTLTVPISFALR